MRRKPTLKKPQPLTAAIIAYMKPGEERGDAQCAGLRVRCLASGQKVFFYRYRGRDGALREIRLGEVGPRRRTLSRYPGPSTIYGARSRPDWRSSAAHAWGRTASSATSIVR